MLISPILITIDSFVSTSSSSIFLVEIVIVPDVSPELITIGLSEIEYSSLSAVPDKVNGIEISRFEVSEMVAVIVKSFSEFSVIVSELRLKIISGGLSPSTIVILISSLILLFAFNVLTGLKVIVSSFSSDESRIAFIVISDDVSPAGITISGFSLTFCIRLLL